MSLAGERKEGWLELNGRNEKKIKTKNLDSRAIKGTKWGKKKQRKEEKER